DPVPPIKVDDKAVAIPTQDPPRTRIPLEENRASEPGPGLGSFFVGSVAVVVLLGGALVLLRRFGKNSRLLGNGGPIRILARRAAQEGNRDPERGIADRGVRHRPAHLPVRFRAAGQNPAPRLRLVPPRREAGLQPPRSREGRRETREHLLLAGDRARPDGP